jgi:hypothetical protein
MAFPPIIRRITRSRRLSLLAILELNIARILTFGVGMIHARHIKRSKFLLT